MKKYWLLLIFAVFITACKRDKTVTPADTSVPKVTSAEYIDSLLFVNKNNYKIQTTDSATFSSADPHIKLNSNGVIVRLTSAEVAPIKITWKNAKKAPITIYALGAMDTNQDAPFLYYQGELATDAYAAYLQGWKTLQKLPVTNETYVIVLRHADASNGIDYSLDHPDKGPDNWWKSTDAKLARQLNEQGIERATALGKIFKDLNYPVKRVVTSEFYRARQTADLMDLGPEKVIDARINHLSHNLYTPGIYQGMLGVVAEQPVDNQMTLIVSHHPINEHNPLTTNPDFPAVSPFNWSGAYLIKLNPDKTLSYQGSASWAMFKCWHDIKLHIINN